MMSRKKNQNKAKVLKGQKKPADNLSLQTEAEAKKIKLALPRELQEKIKSENEPDKIVAEAVREYYGGTRRRAEISIQKEIDNNIIEVQRRHISDLKEQLNTSNKNYEELMRTYQAYMLQVQPMIEAAQKKEIEAKKPAHEKQNETANEKQNETANEKQDVTADEKQNVTAHEKQKEGTFEKKDEEETAEKNRTQISPKKWYEFWK
jgi:hypothetical protein